MSESPQSQTPCDLLVTARWVLPIAPKNEVLEAHALAITNGEITDIGPSDALAARFAPAERIDLDNHILMPGLVNCHGHAAMTLLRGAGEDQTLQDWLSETIWPLEGRLVNEDFVTLGTEIAAAEMLKTGTTTFSSMYFFPNVAARVIDRVGMRAQFPFVVIDFPNAWSRDADDGLHKGMALFNDYVHHPLIDMVFGPHAPYTVARENLAKVTMFAEEMEAQIQIHLHENAAEVTEAQEKTGDTWIAQLYQDGFLTPSVQAVHMTQISDADLERIAETQVSIVHCPTSNAKLASGYCDIHRLKDAGLRVGLGTDGTASNNTLNLFAEARLAALLAKHHHLDATRGSAPDLIEMATLGGARALGLDRRIGSLEAGKEADFISIELDALNLQPMYDPFAALLHGEAGWHVDNAYVRGNPCLKNGELLTLSQTDLSQRLRDWQTQNL